jgi:eukaryotic-like serine/threonine-protein kinase
LSSGDEFGPFRLLHPLGKGGMGEVWKAEQLQPVRRLVALKVIKRGVGSSEILARFAAERQALALMNHPNIARILDAGNTPEGQPYFAMELVEGQPLTAYCDDNQLSIKERLQLFQEVCNGVQHAHQKGVIHRDLKPGNILVTSIDGKPVAKVIDFGLAKAMESTLKLTEQSLFTGIGQILGTLRYMSPEQASLDSVDIDTRTDIYSLGVILYELLTGSTPLESSSIKELTALQVLEFVRDKDPVKPSSRLSSSSDDQVSLITGKRKTDSFRLKQALVGDLDWVIMKAIEKDRTRRYESVSGFAADVLRYLNGEPVVARPPSLNYRVTKFVRKNRIGVVSFALVFIALVGGIIGTTVELFRAREAEKQAKEQGRRADDERAVAETRRIEAEKNLSYAKQGNKILGSVFAKLDPKAEYNNLAEFRNALRVNLQSAVEQLAEAAIDDPLTVTQMQMTLAKSLLALHETALATQLLEQVRDTRIRLLGIKHSDTLESMNTLALSYLRKGDTEQALTLYEQTSELAKSELGLDHSGTLNAMASYASALISAGQLEKALSLMEQAAQLYESKLGASNPETLTITNNLATAYLEFGRLEKALQLLKKVADIRTSTLGHNHPDTLTTMSNLAWVQIEAGQVESAQEIFTQTLERQISTIGANSPDMIYTLSGLAATYEETGPLEKAIELYERSLEIMKLQLGSDHPDTLSSMGNLAGAYYRADQMDKAIKLYEQSIEIMKTKLGPGHPHVLVTVNNLALAYKDSGQLEKAVPLLEQSLQGMKELQFNSQFAFNMFSETIKVYEIAQNYERADHWRQTWQTIIKNEYGEESVQFAIELESQGLAQMTRNELGKAEPVLRQCLAIREKLLPNTWQTFNAQSLLGACLLGMQKYAESESQLLAGYEGMKPLSSTIPPAAVPGILGTLERLIELYVTLEQTEQTDKYRKIFEAYRSSTQ